MSVVKYSFVFDGVMLILIISTLTSFAVTFRNARQRLRGPKGGMQLRAADTADVGSWDRRDVRMLKIFILMTVAYVVTFLPITVGRLFYDVGALDDVSYVDAVVLIGLCHTLYKTSAIFNPLLTMTLREDFRREVTRWFRVRTNNGDICRAKSNLEHHTALINAYSTQSCKDYCFTTYV